MICSEHVPKFLQIYANFAQASPRSRITLNSSMEEHNQDETYIFKAAGLLRVGHLGAYR